jgi:L-fuconolactonase
MSSSERQLTRRRAMLTGVAAIGATALARSSSAAAEGDPNWIDAHSHIWTSDTDRYPLVSGQTRADLDPPSFTDQELMAVAEPEGVRRVVLIQHSVYHLFDNSYVLDAVRRHPKRFRVVGMVDDRKPAPGAAMKRLVSEGVTGFRSRVFASPRSFAMPRTSIGSPVLECTRCGAQARKLGRRCAA